MLGWAIGFFVAAVIAAFFGFGGMASAFSGIAVLLFWVFIGLLVLSLVLSALRTRHGTALHSGARTVFTFVTVAAVGALAYAWIDNDWSAETVGRDIDRNTAEIASNIGENLEEAGARTQTFVENTTSEVRENTAEAFDEAGDTVDPDADRTEQN